MQQRTLLSRHHARQDRSCPPRTVDAVVGSLVSDGSAARIAAARASPMLFGTEGRPPSGGYASGRPRLHRIPLGEGGPASCQAPVSGHPLCDTHNSVVSVALDLIVDGTL